VKQWNYEREIESNEAQFEVRTFASLRFPYSTHSLTMSITRMPAEVRLPECAEAHVWTAFVSEFSTQLSDLEQLLSREEQRAAARFRREADRDHYIIAHGILRRLLGRYLCIAPKDLDFTVNGFGKPAVALRPEQPPLSFNLAHSGDLVLYAVAINRRIGVDVEKIRSELDVMELARSQFSTPEVLALTAVSLPERLGAFFRCWTRKEAYVKARGEGFHFPLNKFAVTFGAEEMPRLSWIDHDLGASYDWSMFHLDPAPGYAGAVTVEGREVQLVSRFWSFFS